MTEPVALGGYSVPMRRAAFITLGLIFVLLTIPLLLNALYNLCGAFQMRDCADGPVWVNVLLTITLGGLAVGAVWAAYRMFRRATRDGHVEKRLRELL